MLYTQTGKIKISTVGASFTVTFSVAPDEIDFLTALHEQYAEMNMSGFTIKSSDSEKPNNCEDEPQTCSFSDCDNFKNPDYARCIECKRKQYKAMWKTEPTRSKMEQVDKDTNVRSKEPQTERSE